MEDEAINLLPKTKGISPYFANEGVELRRLRSYLRWIYVDQSNLGRTCLSWSLFFVVAVIVPLLSHFLLQCSTCDSDHSRPYHVPVQISLSVFAMVSFVSLSRWDRKYGLRKFLFLDKVSEESDKIQQGYAQQLQQTMKLILLWGLPCFIAECAYKIWWYISGASETDIPYYGNIYLSSIVLCTLELFSWLYRTSIFFLVCVLFRLICYLQILRLDDFAQVFQQETDVVSILMEHLRLRRNLRIISHRFRAFILGSLLLVTASQLIFLLMTLKPSAKVDILKAGELTVNISSFPFNQVATPQVLAAASSFWGSDDEVGDEEDELDNTKLLPIYTHTISFHKRQALGFGAVTYLENNRAGITVYGFMLDRTWLHSIFGIQLALCLWLLNKTIGV
ncbi:extracellular ligand-gated ion channel protein [Senna tora]|uniref:Extracellular ligand-gated ion channel protein n=1 Tax=Senna tora TaxID=362788 RepID=A0A834X9I7_9FABA|nr:extracellular ligand-gated ion channel protein [Senna tora]